MKHAPTVIILLLAAVLAGGSFFACGDDDDDARHAPAGDDDDDDAQPPVDDDDDDDNDDDDDDEVDPGDWTPDDFSGIWTGTMDIVMESGQGGGTASILMEIEVADDWSFTGTFSDPTCPDDPACPDQEAVGGSIDLMFATVTFSFRFDCAADGITYFYFMEGAAAWQRMSGDFKSLDELNVQQNHGAWEVTK
ncbi:MAG TPA: hypothetical protein PK961_04885 [bacterium]|nr:hypothetical protein [bacterium]